MTVTITELAHEQLLKIIAHQCASNVQEKNNKKESVTVIAVIDRVTKQLLLSDLDDIKALIAQDPRPAYRREETTTAFVMRYKSVDVSFQLIASGRLQITAVVDV